MEKKGQSFEQIHRTIKRDMRELYDFYINDERKLRLVGMGRINRWWHISWWLLKELIKKLPPARRLLLIFCLFLFIQSTISFEYKTYSMNFNLTWLAFVLLLVILMLELKDKLLARDELEIGRAVQLSLMPERNPQIPGWDIWLFTKPANDVGGDLVDYLQINEQRWAIILGDVSGKGLGAALLMAKLQATIRALAANYHSLSDMGAQINQILCRDGIVGRFATALYFEVNPDSGIVRLLNTGHMPPILLYNQTIQRTPPVAMPLGAFPDTVFVEQSIDLLPGALLIGYSDGLTDACNEKNEFFGDERLDALLPRLHGMTAEQAVTLIKTEVEQFVGEARASDDFSLVILRKL
jgi:phosphoserine phosphatase RsbU/P